ncbi:MAG: DUF1559 domain-containing protein [Planctomycetaceae bacterium]|jgi:hypothetical protein|nr:DUF1559 domain-containing protein [Planctomycetaceae bacterium]
MIPSFIILVLTGIAGIVGVGLLFDTIYFYKQSIKSPSRCIRLVLALLVPPLVALFFTRIGVPLHPDRAAAIVSAALFPCFTILPILFVRLCLTAILSSSKKLNDKVQETENKLAIGFGGCFLPLILFVLIFILYVYIGVKLHDYNPSMDGPPPQIWFCGIDIVKVIDFFVGMTGWAAMFLLFFAGIRLGLQERKKKIELGMLPKKTSIIEILVVIGIVVFLVLLLYPAVHAAREGSRYSVRRSCQNNLSQISFAMMHYHNEYGSFPPAFTTDADGKPLHSWRVLLLPFIYQEQWDSWFAEIRLDEPWDSEHNKQFHQIPKSKFPGRDFSPFCCPDATEKPSIWSFIFDEPCDTNTDRCDYSVIVGSDTLFPGAESGGKDYSRDNVYADQLLIVERQTPICWMNPAQEITQTDAEKGVNTIPNGIGSSHHQGANVVYGDQYFERLPSGLVKPRTKY